jgi:hypothetical protein
MELFVKKITSVSLAKIEVKFTPKPLDEVAFRVNI